MDQQQIKTLIDALAASDLGELEYSENGCTLRLVKKSALTRQQDVGQEPSADARDEPAAASPATECLAPLYGVVHLQPSPGDAPFVAPGQAVRAGQTLCVIEAMKVFNEVRADRDGTVEAVLVASGDEVDAGQTLIRFA